MKHVFIIGSKGIPSAYGGYETFVDRLTEYHRDNKKLKYHVACKNADKAQTLYHNAICFRVKVPDIGPAQAIYYDVSALRACIRYIRKHRVKNPIIYILACRIGPFARYYLKKIHQLGGKMYVNPDGHEWKRSKWNCFVRKYWKISERLMVKNCDLLVCDSVNIEKYIQDEYKKYNPNTTYISYGADVFEDVDETEKNEQTYHEWIHEHDLQSGEYYLIVGRFVPENNYETMIREFMQSGTTKKLVIICNENPKLKETLEERLKYTQDARIHFAGTVYDKALLMNIRKHAYGYLHGHEVGGTNPSLLEALGSTDVNLLLDVGFNREVGRNSALYWSKKQKNLANLIDKVDNMSSDDRLQMGQNAKARIREAYNWKKMADQYEKLFVQGEKDSENTVG